MDEKKAAGRTKRPVKPPEDGSWDCSVCTFKNSAEAYKCEMCDVRKGTSTRKPKINPQLVAQQVAQQYAAPLSPTPGSPQPDDDLDPPFPDPSPRLTNIDTFEAPPPPVKHMAKKEKPISVPKPEKSHSKPAATQPPKPNKLVKKKRLPRSRGSDQNSAREMAVTVDNVTVIITDYPNKKQKLLSDAAKQSTQSDMSDTSSNASNDILDERTVNSGHI